MGTRHAADLLQYLRRLVAERSAGQQTDRELLQRFTGHRDEAAFAQLLERHGPMVLRVCQRVLPQAQDAEDAFQATFLVLTRKAALLPWQASVAGWLYQVAYRLAMKAKTAAARRSGYESRVGERPAGDPLADITLREALALLDEELNRLPENLRAPLVLCFLEGRTQDKAATQLGCSLRTLTRRLERGREVLKSRLARRGLTLSAALCTTLLAPSSTPAALVHSTVKAALLFAAGKGAGAISLHVAALSEGMLKVMFVSKLKVGATLVLALGVLAAGAGLTAYQTLEGKRPEAKGEEGARAAAAKKNQEIPKQEKQARTDRFGDPLPEGAVARLGTLKRRATGAQLALSADGRSIIGVRAGKYVSVWEAGSGKLRETRVLPTESWAGLALSPDGRWLMTDRGTGRLERQVSIWDVQVGKAVQAWTLTKVRYISPGAFSPDGTRVAAVVQVEDGHWVRAWDMATGKEIFARHVPNQGSCDRLAFTPDGRRLIAAIVGMICWDIASGQQIWQNKEFLPPVGQLAFTPDGKILSGVQNSSGMDAATGQLVKVDNLPALAWENRLTLTPDGRTLLVSTVAGVIVWDLVNGKEVRTLACAGEDVVVAPDGRTIITNSGALQRWELATGKPLYPDNIADGHTDEVRVMAFTADGKRLASASADGSVRLWDLARGKPAGVWRGHEARRPIDNWRWIPAGVVALDATPDGRWLLSAGSEEQLRLWDASAGNEIRAIALPERDPGEGERNVFHLRIAPDGARAVGLFGAWGFYISTGEVPTPSTHKLATWDLKTGKLLSLHRIEVTSRWSSAIAPDGRTALANGILFNVASGQQMVRREGVARYASGSPVAFSPDGALVAGGAITTSNQEDGLGVWEAVTGKRIDHLKAKSWAGLVVFHPDNRFVATSHLDGVKVWDLLTGEVVASQRMPEPMHSYWAPNSDASCLAFAPGGRTLATGHKNGSVLLWDIPLPADRPAPLAADELASLWTDLRDADARRAWRAVWRMSRFPGEALALLRERLQPASAASDDVTRRLLADLDSNSFGRRQKAMKELKELGYRAGPALRKALEANPSLEQKRRIEDLLAILARASPPPSPHELRELRAVAVLERMGTPEAHRILESLAKGAPDAPLTQKARAFLERLANRAVSKP